MLCRSRCGKVARTSSTSTRPAVVPRRCMWSHLPTGSPDWPLLREPFARCATPDYASLHTCRGSAAAWPSNSPLSATAEATAEESPWSSHRASTETGSHSAPLSDVAPLAPEDGLYPSLTSCPVHGRVQEEEEGRIQEYLCLAYSRRIRPRGAAPRIRTFSGAWSPRHSGSSKTSPTTCDGRCHVRMAKYRGAAPFRRGSRWLVETAQPTCVAVPATPVLLCGCDVLNPAAG